MMDSYVKCYYYSVGNNANIPRGNSMRRRGSFLTEKSRVEQVERGDATIIVQIKENVNSLSFASRRGIFNGDSRQKEFVVRFPWSESSRHITTDFTGITIFFEGNAAYRWWRFKIFCMTKKLLVCIQKAYFLTYIIYMMYRLKQERIYLCKSKERKNILRIICWYFRKHTVLTAYRIFRLNANWYCE